MSKKQERESAAAFAAAQQPRPRSDATPQLAGYRRSLVKLSGYFLLGCAVGVVILITLALKPQHTTKVPMLKVPTLTDTPVEGGGGYLDPLPDRRPRGLAPAQRSNKVMPLPPAKPLHPTQPRRDA